jgi:hypothetical protein
MDPHRVASFFPPNTTTWVSEVDGFVWIKKQPSEVLESDEIDLSWVRFTNCDGNHRVKVIYWVKTDTQVLESNAIHTRWRDEPCEQSTRALLKHKQRPTKQKCSSRFEHVGSTAHCRRRLEFG